MAVVSLSGILFAAMGLTLPFVAMVQSEEQDSQLVQKVLNGDTQAFRGLVEQYQGRIYNIIYGMVHNRDDAMELTQDTFLKAFRKLNSFNLDSKFYTWLCRIAVNTAIDHIRKMRHRQTSEFDENIGNFHDGSLHDDHYSQNPESAAMNSELRSQIIKAVDELPEEQKQILILKEIDGLSYKEIATVVGVAQGTVMSRLYYARKKLQEILEANAQKI